MLYMAKCEYRIEEDTSTLPRALLVLAEPDEAIIEDYPADCVAAVATVGTQTVGSAVLLQDHDTIEIINLAVDQAHRNGGIATTLLERAISYAREKAVRRVVIRTATASTQQLLLYQRVGFRFSEIDHGYFARNYFHPLIENGVRCVDQVSLVFPLYRQEEQRRLTESYWQDFVLRNPEHTGHAYKVWSFSGAPYTANTLLNLTIQGSKTATSALKAVFTLQKHKQPQQGAISVVTYGDGYPGAILETTAVETRPFNQVDEEHARLEGEGDLSLAYWREVHGTVFEDQLARHGKSFSGKTPVVCERFRLLDVNRELGRM